MVFDQSKSPSTLGNVGTSCTPSERFQDPLQRTPTTKQASQRAPRSSSHQNRHPKVSPLPPSPLSDRFHLALLRAMPGKLLGKLHLPSQLSFSRRATSRAF